jgi:FkbH-like protein
MTLTDAIATVERPAADQRQQKKSIKCVVWDLDHTLWNGVLLEDGEVALRENVADTIRTLDSRGILQSIASRNDHEGAMDQLRKFGLQEYFLYPQINWNSKVASIKAVAKALNIGLDAVGFIDDQVFEREEVTFSLPEVLCIDAAAVDDLLERPEFNPRFITEDSRKRRLLYLSDIERQRAETQFVGPNEEFLATLKMVFTIAPAREEDLMRVDELTVRTNQLNTTGATYSYDELDYFRQSSRHKLLIAGLEDKFGDYGKIGLAFVECSDEVWTIKLLLMSCRVMNRGVGTILLNHIMNLAKQHCVRLRAEFVHTSVNRMMYVTYKFAGFKAVDEVGETTVLENNLNQIQPFPEYVKVQIV